MNGHKITTQLTLLQLTCVSVLTACIKMSFYFCSAAVSRHMNDRSL